MVIDGHTTHKTKQAWVVGFLTMLASIRFGASTNPSDASGLTASYLSDRSTTPHDPQPQSQQPPNSTQSSKHTGVVLILFYQSSSMLTKFKAEVKARFEEDHAPPSSPVKRRGGAGGKDGNGDGTAAMQHAQARTATQVCVSCVWGMGVVGAVDPRVFD